MSSNTLHNKIMKGLELAYNKLVEETAQRDGYLVFSENGKIVKVKARKIKLEAKK